MIATLSQPARTAAPSEQEWAVRVRDLSKVYRVYDQPRDRLKQMLFWRFGRQYGREFWALRGVSFELARGETIGVIGRNGSGKSTLLQMIAGTLAPTTGSVEVRGRVAALLELGSGFNPEFTGRENIFMNGAILGLDQREMAERLDTILEFAEIGEFVDQPTKTYSSGMVVRLAFAVQASINPDILIVDEALAVGDIFFQQKCYRRLETLRQQGVSIIFVSHAMGLVEQFCQRVVLLDHGQLEFIGQAAEAVSRYYLLEQRRREAMMPPGADTQAQEQFHREIDWPDPDAFFDLEAGTEVSNGWARCTAIGLSDATGHGRRVFAQGESASFFYEFELLHDIAVPIGGLELQNMVGVLVHGKNTLQHDLAVPPHISSGKRIRFRQDVQLNLAVGEYTFEVGLATMTAEQFERRHLLAPAEVNQATVRVCHSSGVGQFSVKYAPEAWPIQERHYGVADLPGQHHFTLVDEPVI